MDKRRAALLARAGIRYLAGLALMMILIFLPAGTLSWHQGWLLMGVLFVPMLIAGLALLWRAPELLEKRLNARESQPEQQRVVRASAVMFVSSFVLAGLNRRFHWPALPDAACRAAAGVFLLGYGMYAEVLRENAYLSRTVEVQAGQRVVDTGLYGMVRHPMYLSTLLMFLTMPLILGAPPAFAVMLACIPILRRRIMNEEAVLARDLPGYTAYMEKVRYRLIPFVW